MRKIYIFDIEVYNNYFLIVFYDIKEDIYTHYIIWEGVLDERKELLTFAKINKDSFFIGYNSLRYDMPIVDYILKNPLATNKDIKDLSNRIIDEDLYFNPKTFMLTTLCLMLINNYGPRSAKSTSLKKLEFNLRKKKIMDLPYHHTSDIKTEKQSEEIIKYCKWDCLVTRDVFDFSKDLITLRAQFGKLHDIDILNSPEPDMGKKYFYKYLSEAMGIPEYEFSKLKTYHDKIVIKDIIFDYIKFDLPIYNEVLDYYKSIVLYPTLKSNMFPDKKVINLKGAIEKIIEYKGLKTDYKAGGLHGAVSPGIYYSDDKYMIVTADFKSYYPHIQFKNDISPKHIPSNIYCSLLDGLYQKRESYDKKTHYILNYSLKILINLVFGLSNSEYGALYDTEFTLKTTINGMLILSMMADKIYTRLPEAIILSKNTDGIEVKILRTDYDKLIEIFDEIQSISKIPYEIDFYDKYVIRDINNYVAITKAGKKKVKGVFETYEDIIATGSYHKDTSGSIIPLALQEYFINNKLPEETINNHNNIYDFCYGAKSSSRYRWVITQLKNGIATNRISEDRFLRYYMGGNDFINKLWVSGARKDSFELVQSTTPVTLCQNIAKDEINSYNKKGEITMSRYKDLNRNWYIHEVYKIINTIENYEEI